MNDRKVYEPEDEAGSYLRLRDFVYQSTLGLRVIKKKKKKSLKTSPLRDTAAPSSDSTRCRGTWLIGNIICLGPYIRTMPRAQSWP